MSEIPIHTMAEGRDNIGDGQHRLDYRTVSKKPSTDGDTQDRRDIEKSAKKFYKQLKERSYVTKPKTKETTDGSGDS